MQQVKERDVAAEQALAEQVAVERDARYRAMLPHERFCLPGHGQVLARVERYTAYRDEGDRSVSLTITRCMECAAILVTPFEKEIL